MTTTEQHVVERLIAQGYLEVHYQFGIKAVALTEEGAWAAAVLYGLLSPEAKATMPELNFVKIGETKRAKRRAR